ncbi:MAG TPA: cation diffusion facilitator family transporter [Anaerolineales bacterium]|nr:cation diffusion facilitator family transporter [Anaerolineales bacterium]HRQ93045.1 cation diffusion facilitator family transporter [Anaerolineales bacterium]
MEIRPNLTRYAWLSIAAAVVTIGLKTGAYWVTGSVGLLSDALESLVNLAGAVLALWMLSLAAAPPDEDHAYGHTKAEYFSSVIEGVLIILAAVSIAYSAIRGLLNPQPLESIGLGLAVSVLASLINLVVAQVLLRAARRHNSASLEANAQHLMTDVWTSASVLAAVGLVALSGWQVLDPIIALVVAANITYSGVKIVRKSAAGLLDAALPPEQLAAVHAAIQSALPEGVQYHALRSRQSGARSFVSLHVLVPGGWTVVRGHRLLEQVEAAVRAALSGDVTVFTHLESIGDVASYEDEGLDR